jgi:sensor histidine kinase regulating citrate/malate metabolism
VKDRTVLFLMIGLTIGVLVGALIWRYRHERSDPEVARLYAERAAGLHIPREALYTVRDMGELWEGEGS